MRKRDTDALVGLVVLIVTVLTIAGIVWVRQASLGGRRRTVVAHFRDVGNARVGNSVVVRGVIAGRIQAIELAPNGFVNVRMRLDPAIRLPAGPVALLGESSLFGEWQATIIGRDALPHDEALEREVADAAHEPGGIPGATLPGLAKLTAVAGQIAGDVASVAGRVQVAFDAQAARELHESIHNISDLSSTLATTVRAHATDLDTLSTQLRAAIATLQQTATTVQTTASRVDSAAGSAQVHQIVEDLTAGAAQMRRAATQVNELTRRVAGSQDRLDALLVSTDSVMTKIDSGRGSLGLLVNDPSVYRHTDSLLVGLNALITDIRANPKRYLSVRIF